jgi:hypothetical protein
MPDLSFQVIGAEAGARGLVPLLYFKLRIGNAPAEERIPAVILRTQIQLEPMRRAYAPSEKERLGELFGTPERWGQTLRNKLWTHVDISVPPFAGAIEVRLPVPCTYDVNVLATKYFYALEGGEVSLRFLFSGTIFHATKEGRLQVQQISWERECGYVMPVQTWRALMEQFFPENAWIYLQRDVFDRLYAYRRRHGLPTWEDAVGRLLAAAEVKEVAPA